VYQTLAQLGSNVDGILILIDEADKPSAGSNLGEFVKLFTERLTKRGCNHVFLGLAGLSELLPKLRQSHESSLRIFEMLTLESLQPNESIIVEITPNKGGWLPSETWYLLNDKSREPKE